MVGILQYVKRRERVMVTNFHWFTVWHCRSTYSSSLFRRVHIDAYKRNRKILYRYPRILKRQQLFSKNQTGGFLRSSPYWNVFYLYLTLFLIYNTLVSLPVVVLWLTLFSLHPFPNSYLKSHGILESVSLGSVARGCH